MQDNSLLGQHYTNNSAYLNPRRLQAYIHQAKFLKTGEEILEIGPGPGIFGQIAKNVSKLYHSMDYDANVVADFHGDVADPDLVNKIGRTYDTVFCCQVLEHVPFEKSLIGLSNVLRLARKRAIVSIPDNRIGINVMVNFVKWYYSFVVTIPFTGKEIKQGDPSGHFWEINHKNFRQIRYEFKNVAHQKLVKEFRSGVRPYQHFFIFEK